MDFKRETFDYFINLIKKGGNFSLSKIGDGELICIFKSINWLDEKQFGNKNADNHQYFNDMGEALHKTFTDEKGYYKYFHPGWMDSTVNRKELCELFQKYVKEYDISPPNLYDSRISFYRNAESGDLGPLKEELEKRNFVMVSEYRKQKLPIKFVDFINAPKTNSWLEKDRIKKDIISMIEKYDSPIFGLSLGMSSVVIIDELYPIIGDKCTMINFGSMWDPFVNIKCRKYHHKYKTTKL